MSAKKKQFKSFNYNSYHFSYKAMGEFRARSHAISLNKGLLNTSLHLC